MLSEIMLQQTTVKTVIPYYEKFLRLFPRIEDLAKAPEEKVMSLWSGLGYYSRARNLHRLAKVVTIERKFPHRYEDLLKLPGLGPYTAAAVASFAFNQPVAAIDGNIARVISRLADIDLDISTSQGKRALVDFANKILDPKNSALHNQAIMELGATICLPQNPSCLLCPVMNQCLSQKRGNQNLRPVKKKKRAQEPWIWNLFLASQNGKIALTQLKNGTPWLKNTWVLPGKAQTISKPPKKFSFRHSITHHKIYVQVKRAKSTDLKPFQIRWVSQSEIESFGVSSVVFKALKYLQENQ